MIFSWRCGIARVELQGTLKVPCSSNGIARIRTGCTQFLCGVQPLSGLGVAIRAAWWDSLKGLNVVFVVGW